MGKAPAPAPAHSGGFTSVHHERPLNAAPAVAAAAANVSSERVRSTVASIEAMASSPRIAFQTSSPLAMPAPQPQLALAGPRDARGHLRYLHHRVAGASSNHSRDMLK
jgi:hypothetical protein